MAKFAYVAKDKEGHTIKGDVEAPDKKQALEVLRKKEFLILKLEPVKEGAKLISFSFRRGVKVTKRGDPLSCGRTPTAHPSKSPGVRLP